MTWTWGARRPVPPVWLTWTWGAPSGTPRLERWGRRRRHPSGLGQGRTQNPNPQHKERTDAHRNPRGLRRDARPGEGRQVRLPGHQRDLQPDPARGAARLRGGGERRHRPDLHGWRRVPRRPVQQGHGDRRGRARRVRAHRRGEVPGQHRAAHRPLPEGQARRVRPSAARPVEEARRLRSRPAVPVPHVGRLRRDPRRQPGDRAGAAGAGPRRQDHPGGGDHPDRR
ncbi:hypothetical protein SGPA1_50530 [Streptomyces misionensis JCM 4497]